MNGGARETGPALESHYRFLLWLAPTAERFSRSQKFPLGTARGRLLGSQVVSGRGKLVGTAAGTFAGALPGREVGKSPDNADRAAADKNRNSASASSCARLRKGLLLSTIAWMAWMARFRLAQGRFRFYQASRPE